MVQKKVKILVFGSLGANTFVSFLQAWNCYNVWIFIFLIIFDSMLKVEMFKMASIESIWKTRQIQLNTPSAMRRGVAKEGEKCCKFLSASPLIKSISSAREQHSQHFCCQIMALEALSAQHYICVLMLFAFTNLRERQGAFSACWYLPSANTYSTQSHRICACKYYRRAHAG